jgi:leader peptidase (prepilin peptidase) / N-methyltransferase
MEVRLLEGLLAPPALALIGLCIGSFLNVVIHRLPLMLERSWKTDSAELLGLDPAAYVGDAAPVTLSRPRSRCTACGHLIAWHENIPVLSWLRLGGRCSACRTRISPRYPLVEILTALLFAAIGWHFGPGAQAVVWCIAAALLIAMTMIDIDTRYLPDDLTLPLIGLAVLAAGMGWSGVPLPDAAWGAWWGYVSLWSVNQLYRLVRGQDGMGEGDFKLLAGLGALLGWKLLPSIILLSSAVGAVVGVGLMAFRGRSWAQPLPFGPYLAGGGLAAVFFGDALTHLYFPSP